MIAAVVNQPRTVSSTVEPRFLISMTLLNGSLNRSQTLEPVTPRSLSHHFAVIPLHMVPDYVISLIQEGEEISHK